MISVSSFRSIRNWYVKSDGCFDVALLVIDLCISWETGRDISVEELNLQCAALWINIRNEL
jgi:hypothetical protein